MKINQLNLENANNAFDDERSAENFSKIIVRCCVVIKWKYVNLQTIYCVLSAMGKKNYMLFQFIA